MNKRSVPAVLAAIVVCCLLPCLLACGSQPAMGNADTPTPEPTQAPTPTPVPTPTPTPEPKNRSQTSGRVVAEGTPSRPVIVSIENSEGARPQTGLMRADIIYEFIVESMITRFQALFHDEYPLYAGPLRSARYYFIDLAQEWSAMYLHEGYGPPKGSKYHYSPKQIESKVGVYPRRGVSQFNGYASTFSLKKGAYTDYEAKNGYRFRSRDRAAPHNLYVLVDRMAHRYYGEHTAAVRERFRFMEGVSYESGEAFQTVSLPYQNTYYPEWVQFQYSAEENLLYRYQDDARFMVRTLSADGETYDLEQMRVQNLIVQYVKYGRMEKDDKGRRTCELTGSGKCDYFINGRHVTGTWSRPTLEDFTIYQLDDGSVVILEPGSTWVAVHPDDTPVTID